MAEAAARLAPQSTADRTLVIERTFNASPERVFAAWTEPAMLARWWGPEGAKLPGALMDFRVGGRYRTAMTGPDGNAHIMSGVYKEIVPPRRLVFTWAWEEDGKRGHETEITIDLEPAGKATKMRFVQEVFATSKALEGHQMGWDASFALLDKALA
jgi:uncharacterized protein YndB with AHSA1/START domain